MTDPIITTHAILSIINNGGKLAKSILDRFKKIKNKAILNHTLETIYAEKEKAEQLLEERKQIEGDMTKALNESPENKEEIFELIKEEAKHDEEVRKLIFSKDTNITIGGDFVQGDKIGKQINVEGDYNDNSNQTIHNYSKPQQPKK